MKQKKGLWQNTHKHTSGFKSAVAWLIEELNHTGHVGLSSHVLHRLDRLDTQIEEPSEFIIRGVVQVAKIQQKYLALWYQQKYLHTSGLDLHASNNFAT